MRAEYKYTELAKQKYLTKVADKGRMLSGDYFFYHDIDLTQEYCEVAVECNPNMVRNGKIEDLIEWVMIQSNNTCDEIIIRDCLASEFEALAFVHKE